LGGVAVAAGALVFLAVLFLRALQNLE